MSDATNHENEINAKIRTQSNFFCFEGIFFVSEGLERLKKSKFGKKYSRNYYLISR